MYRRPKFLEVLLEIRQEMAREADFDTDLFAEMVRSGRSVDQRREFALSETGAADAGKTAAGKNKRRPSAKRKS